VPNYFWGVLIKVVGLENRKLYQTNKKDLYGVGSENHPENIVSSHSNPELLSTCEVFETLC